MKQTAVIFVLTIGAMIAADSPAQAQDHFARQRREAAARQDTARFDAPRYTPGHWGGPTTTHRYYNPIRHQNTQFYPVNPFGYGIPNCGYYGGGYHGGFPYYGSSGPGVYIHREIYLSR